MAKKTHNKNKWAFSKNALRRASRYWWSYSEAESRGRVSRGLYLCASCQEQFKRKEVQIDHINPVVSTDGGTNDLNTYVDTLFCDPENLQLLCLPCHKIKSGAEQTLRAQARKEKAAAKPKKPRKKKEVDENTK